MPESRPEEVRSAKALVHAAEARLEARRATAASTRLAEAVTEALAVLALLQVRPTPARERFGGWPRPAQDGRPRSSSLSAVDLIPGSSRPVLGPGGASRSGFVIRNEGPDAALVAFAPECTPDLYSTLILPGAEYPDPAGYLGPISGTTLGAAAHLVVTELLTS